MSILKKIIFSLIAVTIILSITSPASQLAQAAGSLSVNSQMPTQTGKSANGSSLTYSFTNTSGTLLLVCAVAGSPGQTIIGVKYSGVALSPIANVRTHDGTTGGYVSMWYLKNPAAGANNVVVTANTTGGYLTSGATSFTGNDSSNPIKQSNTNHGNPGSGIQTVSLAGTTLGNYVVDCDGNGSAIGASNHTLTWKKNTNNNNYGNNGASSYASGTGGSVTMTYPDNGDGWGMVAAEIAAAGNSDIQAPSIPTNFSATAVSTSQINLTWTASTDNVGVTGYKIYRNGVQVGTSGTNNYSDSGLTASTQYTYNVSAYDAAGNNSGQSTSASATTQDPPLTLPVISSFSASPSNIVLGSSTTLSWSATGNPAPTLSINNGVGAVTGSNIAVSPTQTTTYTLTATNSQGQATANATVTVTQPDTIPPSIPTNLSATAVSTSQINLSWTASTDNVSVAGYKVFRDNLQIATSTSSSYQDTGLNPSTNYSYAISAFDDAGNVSALSSTVSTSTQDLPPPDTIPPSTPTNLFASAVSSTQINLSWTASTDNVGVTGYKVFRAGIQIATTSSLSYSDIGLTASTTYSYVVSAYDAAGNNSAQSSQASATTQGLPSSAVTEITAAECSAASNKCNLGSHQLEDLEITVATRANNTAPTVPSGYTQITQSGANNWSMTVAYRVLNGTETTTGTFTNATAVATYIFRGADLTNHPIGGTALYSAAATTTMKYCGTDSGSGCGTLTLMRTDGTSWLLGIGTCASCTAGNVAPAGMTLKSGISTTGLAMSDTAGGVSAWTTQTENTATSGALRGIVIELLAAPTSTSCSTNCPTLIQDRNYGTNDSIAPLHDLYFDTPEPTLANNLLICGYTYAGTVTGGIASPSMTVSDNEANSWTVTPLKDDGTYLVGFAYVLGATAGTQQLHFHLSAQTQDFSAHCSEFNNVATSSALDGMSATTGQTGPLASSGNVTTTQANDLLFVYSVSAQGYPTGSNVKAFIPSLGFNLLTSDPNLTNSAEFMAWGGSGAINPAMYMQQSTPTSFDVATIAFKNAAAGTPYPSTGMRIACMGEVVTNSNPTVLQPACPVATTPNLIFVPSNQDTNAQNFSSITDTDGNTFAKLPDAGGFPQFFYADASHPFAFTNSNTRTMTINSSFVNYGGPVFWYIITGAATSSYDTTLTSAVDQTTKAASNTICANDPNSNTSVSINASAANGLVFVADNNGTGPECGASGPGNVFDAVWYPQETDNDSLFTAASGYGHIHNTTAGPWTYTFNWANSQSTGASGAGLRIASFKSQ